MKISEENKYELFDQFISGQMNHEESLRFEALLKGDVSLLAEFNLVKELQKVKEFSIQEAKLKSTLSSIHSANTSKSKWMKYAGFALLLSLLSFLLFQTIQNQSKSSYQDIPMAMFEPLELTTKSNEVQANLRTMQDLYNQKEFKKAMPYLLSHLESKPNDLDILLAQGIAHMELQQFSQADAVFDKISDLEPRVKKFRYYKSLNLLKQGRNSEAKILLKEIVNENGFGFEHAKKLISTVQ